MSIVSKNRSQARRPSLNTTSNGYLNLKAHQNHTQATFITQSPLSCHMSRASRGWYHTRRSSRSLYGSATVCGRLAKPSRPRVNRALCSKSMLVIIYDMMILKPEVGVVDESARISRKAIANQNRMEMVQVRGVAPIE